MSQRPEESNPALLGPPAHPSLAGHENHLGPWLGRVGNRNGLPVNGEGFIDCHADTEHIGARSAAARIRVVAFVALQPNAVRGRMELSW